MTVADIGEARRRREDRARRVAAAADWVIGEIPWTADYRFHPDFSRKCAGMDHSDLVALNTELTRWANYVEHEADISLLAQSLSGRPERYMSATAWLFDDRSRRLHDQEFCRRFGDLTRAELVLAIAEHQRLTGSFPQ